MTELLVVRLAFALTLGTVAYFVRPFSLPAPLAAAVGVAGAVVTALIEIYCRRAHLHRVIGGAAGALTAALIASLVCFVIRGALPSGPTSAFAQVFILGVLLYSGAILGAQKAGILDLGTLGGVLSKDKPASPSGRNILDTSVIIDGRIADIAETGFLDGTFVIPQFVLRELQLVADSADSIKRNRGRRGLDVLQRLQKMTRLQVEIMEDDFPAIRDVDMKLVELGKLYGCKVVTNDFNLNKIAQLHGVQVLNINELANALKPIVLPGETMRVFVLKEGKEYNQGVAYLDDGTMVVVDNARKMISKTIDIAVTSVLQTTAGKMIFGRFDERSHAIYEKAPERKEREQTGAAAGPSV